jgi:hypothetical protein
LQSLGDAQHKHMQEISITIKKRILNAIIRRDKLLYLKTLYALKQEIAVLERRNLILSSKAEVVMLALSKRSTLNTLGEAHSKRVI